MKRAAKLAKSASKPTGSPRRTRKKKHLSAFFVSRTLKELAKEQGVGPLTNPNVLLGGWPEDESLDEFLRKTYEDRSASSTA